MNGSVEGTTMTGMLAKTRDGEREMKSEGTKGTDRCRRRTDLVTLRMLHVAFGKFWAENGLLTNCYISLATELSPRKEKKKLPERDLSLYALSPQKRAHLSRARVAILQNAH